ncbi:uncharacterized protein [Panulirus ornatus]|uniref:uncharacterized protein n=1 Tax=Panulirus ornatus TaxID=150431 RepID=UPI003A8943EF
MNIKVLILLAVAAVATADSREFYAYAAPHSSSEESYESSEAQYNFNWAVQHGPSGNDFGHQEARDGDDTQGSYYVQLPDGRLQTVNYRVQGDSGYVAQVNYEGQARYPGSFESFESSESREYTPLRPVRFDSFESREFVPSRPRHFDSLESREFFPFRPRTFDSLESFESPVFVPSRPRSFGSRESFNSFESREFAPLRRVYG